MSEQENDLDEIFIIEEDFPNKNPEEQDSVDKLLNKHLSQTTVVFEAERSAYYRGVTNCNANRDKQYVNRVSDSFAKKKEAELGLKLLSHGWRSYRARRRSGGGGWPSTGRWCTSQGVFN